MGLSTKAILRLDSLMVEGSSILQVVISIEVSLRKVRRVVRGSSSLVEEESMMVSLIMMFSMGLESSAYLIIRST